MDKTENKDENKGGDRSGDYIIKGVRHTHKQGQGQTPSPRKGIRIMSKTYKTFGVVITTKNGAKVMGIYGNEYPTKNDIRLCLQMERKQELHKIMNGNSGWRKKENIDKEIMQVDYSYADAILAINTNQYKIKVLG